MDDQGGAADGLRVNVGCGTTPTEGWLNFDNSPSVALARWPVVGGLATGLPGLGGASSELVAIARRHRIRWADSRRLPLKTGAVAAYYSSHMLEHVDHAYHGDSRAVLREAFRVLRPGGVLRLVLPDLAALAARYVGGQIDADRFMAESCLTVPAPRGLRQRLKAAVVGPRHHQWMYDRHSLTALVLSCGFVEVAVLAPGETRLPDPGALDLRQRAEEGSLYLEAARPAGA